MINNPVIMIELVYSVCAFSPKSYYRRYKVNTNGANGKIIHISRDRDNISKLNA